MILNINQRISFYSVQSFLHQGPYSESYVVQDSNGTKFVVKIYDSKKVPQNIIKSDSVITEINFREKLNHPNVVCFVENGVYEKEGNKYPYFVSKFVEGFLVADPLSKGRFFSLEMALGIIKNVLKGLIYIHSNGLVHNDITPRNIIYNPKELSSSTIIDLAHVCAPGDGLNTIEVSDMTDFYRAPETYKYVFNERTDIYSVAAVLYTMLFGKAPWFVELSTEKLSFGLLKDLMSERLSFSGSIDNCPIWLQDLLRNCLSFDPEERIQTASEFLRLLDEEQSPVINNQQVKSNHSASQLQTSTGSYSIETKKGGGFADVAGMDDIKAMLQQKVLFLLKNPDKAKKYRLTLPNGMLLYGPPGCGKTFFAEKFAEEAKLNYICIKCSDIGSSYIHGSQNNIAKLFKEAELKAPTVICFDEFDAMVPQRSSAESSALTNPEVNEFLSQMNNCSQRGIFIIATTNQKELIDSAVLRTGRLDLHIKIDAPDQTARKKLFDLYLKSRPCENVDTEELAVHTDCYSASDIAFITNDAALVAAFQDSPIKQTMLLDSIKNRSSSLGEVKNTQERRKVGFK